MGLVGNLFKGKSKQHAFHSDAIILKEIGNDGEELERVFHFLILPQKKNLFSVAVLDGSEPRNIETDLPLQAALKRMKQRFLLKQEALGTLAQTRGASVHIDSSRVPLQKIYDWLPIREVFNFVATDEITGSIN